MSPVPPSPTPSPFGSLTTGGTDLQNHACHILSLFLSKAGLEKNHSRCHFNVSCLARLQEATVIPPSSPQFVFITSCCSPEVLTRSRQTTSYPQTPLPKTINSEIPSAPPAHLKELDLITSPQVSKCPPPTSYLIIPLPPPTSYSIFPLWYTVVLVGWEFFLLHGKGIAEKPLNPT